jgi:hypothetical protein
MRVLVDECIDERLRREFPGHDCQTARYARLDGLENGMLLTGAEAAGFEVIVTVDQEIQYQQNIEARRVGVLILCAATNRLRDLQKLVPVSSGDSRCRSAGRSRKSSLKAEARRHSL